MPRRSALVLTGESRYLWKHSISSRKIDRLENDLLFRRTRLSLTFRKTSEKPHCDCPYHKFCDFWIKEEDQKVEINELGK